MYFIADAKAYFLVFYRVQCHGQLYLTYFFVSCFSLLINQMIIQLTILMKVQKIVLGEPDMEAKSLFNWFPGNQMKANLKKCHLLINSTSQSELKIGIETIKSITYEKLLGIKIDKKLRLNAHIEVLCKKTSRKIYSLARVTPFMAVWKRHIFTNVFVRSKFSYCQLVKTCHSRTRIRLYE